MPARECVHREAGWPGLWSRVGGFRPQALVRVTVADIDRASWQYHSWISYEGLTWLVRNSQHVRRRGTDSIICQLCGRSPMIDWDRNHLQTIIMLCVQSSIVLLASMWTPKERCFAAKSKVEGGCYVISHCQSNTPHTRIPAKLYGLLPFSIPCLSSGRQRSIYYLCSGKPCFPLIGSSPAFCLTFVLSQHFLLSNLVQTYSLEIVQDDVILLGRRCLRDQGIWCYAHGYICRYNYDLWWRNTDSHMAYILVISKTACVFFSIMVCIVTFDSCHGCQTVSMSTSCHWQRVLPGFRCLSTLY